MHAGDIAEEVRALVRQLGCPRPGETWAAAFLRLARSSGIPERRIRAFAYGEARRIEAQERDRLRELRIKELQEEAHRIQHELATARLRWGFPDDLAVDGKGLRGAGGVARAAG